MEEIRMENAPLAEQLRHVKRSLRGMMNGTASHSMREKGLTYKVNFGVELPRLRNFAGSLPRSRELAAALWKEDIRECRLLAGLLMPHDMPEDLAELWVEQMRFPEEADCTVMHLLQYLPCASQCAFRWVADERRMFRYTAYGLFARLFRRGLRPSTRDAQELLDHIEADLHGPDRLTARAAYGALLHYAELGLPEERLAERVFEGLK